MRVVFAAVLAGIALLTGCSSDIAVPVTAKVSEPTAHAELKPAARHISPVSSIDGLNPECASNLQAISLSVNKSRDFVEVGDSGIVVKTRGATAPHPSSSATYVFKDAQPDVRSVFVTVATSQKYDDHTGLVLPPVTHHYEANWPLQAQEVPTAVSVEADDFFDGTRLVGITLCKK